MGSTITTFKKCQTKIVGRKHLNIIEKSIPKMQLD